MPKNPAYAVPQQKLTEADLKDAVIVQFVESAALPYGLAVVVQHKNDQSGVVWFGPANMIPDHDWEPGTTVNVDPATFQIVKAKAAAAEKGVHRDPDGQ